MIQVSVAVFSGDEKNLTRKVFTFYFVAQNKRVYRRCRPYTQNTVYRIYIQWACEEKEEE